jgi:chemotaxis protein methyltransferase CheR
MQTTVEMASLTAHEFRLFQTLVHREAGIFLSEQKRALLFGRLAPRIRALALPSFKAYYDHVVADRDALTHMLDAICTNETSFFREPKQFAFLEGSLLPSWRLAAERGERRRQVRVWSAGCSTGEEPYSIAMSLAAALPDWSIEIVASDLSTKVLQRAAAGIWPMERAEQIPIHYRKTFMLRGNGEQEGRMAARPELSSLIRFARINLNGDSWPLAGRFDLIFCRNVLIYFDGPSKRRIVDRLLDRLQPSGLLFLGHSESLGTFERVRVAGPTIYALREGA